ncbi:BnaA05g15980D [Brassica napus]|uniref:BnaA05g15980D protein n=1 Tax=Brassica napus TaxID=3708 RepID=A0A078GUX1_BRANA|nr:BnaA05g15980D [Brassica napus]
MFHKPLSRTINSLSTPLNFSWNIEIHTCSSSTTDKQIPHGAKRLRSSSTGRSSSSVFGRSIAPNASPVWMPPKASLKPPLDYPYKDRDNRYYGDVPLVRSRNKGYQREASAVRDEVCDEIASNSAVENGNDSKDPQKEVTMLQKRVLRTNCIDCLDRTNVAQYAYDNPLAEDLMGVYETMGDTLALQYGGSAAHNKAWSVESGYSVTRLFRTLQRYYSNAYMDAEKQDAINLFLGYFQPQLDKPALWEMGSDQHYNAARFLASSVPEISRSTMKRSLSESSILSEGSSTVAGRHGLGEKDEEFKGLSDSAPGIISTSKTTAMIAGSFSAPPATLEDIGLDEILENDCFCFNDDRRGGDQFSLSGASCEDDKCMRASTVVRSFETIPESTKIE